MLNQSAFIYRNKVALYNERVKEFITVTEQRDDIKKQYDDWRKKRMDTAGFNAISLKLKEMYQMVTLGGDAELELVDSLDFSLRVCFSVSDLQRRVGKISPTYEEAKDFKKVSIVGHYVKDRTKDVQFITGAEPLGGNGVRRPPEFHIKYLCLCKKKKKNYIYKK